MNRRLLNLLTALSLMLCVTFGASWVFSYFRVSHVGFKSSGAGYFVVSAGNGVVAVGWLSESEAKASIEPGFYAGSVPAQEMLSPNTFWMARGFYRSITRGLGGNILFPHWVATMITGLPPTLVLWRQRQRRWRSVRLGLCPRCGYDLRATPNRCPECGATP